MTLDQGWVCSFLQADTLTLCDLIKDRQKLWGFQWSNWRSDPALHHRVCGSRTVWCPLVVHPHNGRKNVKSENETEKNTGRHLTLFPFGHFPNFLYILTETHVQDHQQILPVRYFVERCQRNLPIFWEFWVYTFKHGNLIPFVGTLCLWAIFSYCH